MNQNSFSIHKVLTVAFVIVFVLLIVVLIVGEVLKSSDNSVSASVKFDERFERLFSDDDFRYYRDSVTDVMYLSFKTGYAGGLTVMLEPGTGLPLTYSKYLSLSELGGFNFESK